MGLKEKFLIYVELQRNARLIRDTSGSNDLKTLDAYAKANEVKRQVLDMIDELEHRMESLDK